MNIAVFMKYFLIPLYKPRKSIKSLLLNERKVQYSVFIFLILGVIYTISVHSAFINGIKPQVEPFLKISVDEYYKWQRFWQTPFFFITSIIFAGVVRLLSSAFNGKGNFEDIFCLFCVAQTLPMFLLMWLPETLSFILIPNEPIQPFWLDIIRQVVGILWPLGITILGLSMIEKLKWYVSCTIIIISAIPITLLMVIFIR
jgi:hypothetical protein